MSTDRTRRRRTGRVLRVFAALAAVAVVSVACSSSGGGGGDKAGGDSPKASSPAKNTAMPEQVRIYSCCVSGTEIPVWLAYDENLFAKYGVNAAPLQTLPPPAGGLALLSGSIDIGNDSPTTLLNAVAGGNDEMIFVAGKTSKPVYHLMTNKLTDPAQIKGKRLGVSGKYAAPAAAAYAYLKDKFGLLPDKDYTVVPSAKISDLVPALANNTIDVAVLSTPLYLQSKAKGAKVLADLSESVDEGNSYVLTTRTFAQKYPAAVEGYIKAITEAMAIAKKDKAKAVASIMKHQQGVSQSDAEITYDEYINLFDPNMYTKAFAPYIDFPSTPEVAKVDVQKTMDSSFLKDLDSSGFLKDHGFSYETK